MAKDADGNVIKVGMVVGFKSDIEQEGKVVAIKRNFGRDVVVLEALSERGFTGDYIGGSMRTTEDPDRVWVED